jgi:hypothetical protein
VLQQLTCALLAGLAALGSARAAAPAGTAVPIIDLRLDGTPSVFVDAAGQVSACGLRVFGIETLAAPRDVHRTVDVSILMGPETVTQGLGLVKASSMEASSSAVAGGQPMRPLRVSDGWLRVPGSARSAPRDGKPLADDERAASVRYLADAQVLFAIADAALEGRPLEASVVRDGQTVHPVYRGAVTMDVRSRQQFVACVRALQARVTAGSGGR